MKIILMGPPGSGKGTQASHIADLAGVHSVSSGDLFRDNLSTSASAIVVPSTGSYKLGLNSSTMSPLLNKSIVRSNSSLI